MSLHSDGDDHWWIRCNGCKTDAPIRDTPPAAIELAAKLRWRQHTLPGGAHSDTCPACSEHAQADEPRVAWDRLRALGR